MASSIIERSARHACDAATRVRLTLVFRNFCLAIMLRETTHSGIDSTGQPNGSHKPKWIAREHFRAWAARFAGKAKRLTTATNGNRTRLHKSTTTIGKKTHLSNWLTRGPGILPSCLLNRHQGNLACGHAALFVQRGAAGSGVATDFESTDTTLNGNCRKYAFERLEKPENSSSRIVLNATGAAPSWIRSR